MMRQYFKRLLLLLLVCVLFEVLVRFFFLPVFFLSLASMQVRLYTCFVCISYFKAKTNSRHMESEPEDMFIDILRN